MSEKKKSPFQLLKESLAKTGCCGAPCTPAKKEDKSSKSDK